MISVRVRGTTVTFLVLLFLTLDLGIFFSDQLGLQLGVLSLQTGPDLASSVAAQLSSSEIPGQRNVPSRAPPLAGWGSLLSFSLGAQSCTNFHWKHFSRHSFRMSAMTINWSLNSVILFYTSLSPSLSFSALRPQERGFIFIVFVFFLYESISCILSALMSETMYLKNVLVFLHTSWFFIEMCLDLTKVSLMDTQFTK